MDVPGVIISQTDRAVSPDEAAMVEGRTTSPSVDGQVEWIARPPEETPTR